MTQPAFTATATAPGPVLTSAVEQVGDGMASLAPVVTLHDVELAAVGDWDGSSGKVKLTRERLQAMADASRDPAVDAPAIHLGHFDARFAATRTGEPALGYVGNVRVSSDGQKLVGDLQGVPAKLAAMIPHAYRRRSIEAAWDVPTPGGRTLPAVLTGLALLGVQSPAVKGLGDVMALFSASPSTPGAGDSIVSIYVGEPDTPAPAATPATASGPGGHDGAMTNTPQLNEARVRQLMEQGGDDAVRELMAGLGAPAPAVEPVQPTTSAPATPAAPVTPASPVVAQTPSAPAPVVGVQPGGQAPAEAPAAPADPVAIAASAGTAQPGTVTLSAAVWGEVQQVLTETRERRRGEVITAALSTGRIAPAEVDAYRAQLARDEEGTTALLSQLQPRFAVLAAGGPGVQLAAGTHDDAAYDAFDRSLDLGIAPVTTTTPGA